MIDDARTNGGSPSPATLPNRRLLRWSGLTAAATLLIGSGMLGDSPDTRDSTESIAAYFVAHSGAILAGVVLLTLSVCAFVVFASCLSERFVRASHHVAGRVAQASSTLVAALILTSMVVVYATLAYVVGAEAAASAKGIYEVTLVTTPIVAAPLAVLYSTTAWVTLRTGNRRWPGWLSAALAVVLVGSTVSWAPRGAFSPDVQQQVVFQTFVVWLVVASLAF